MSNIFQPGETLESVLTKILSRYPEFKPIPPIQTGKAEDGISPSSRTSNTHRVIPTPVSTQEADILRLANKSESTRKRRLRDGDNIFDPIEPRMYYKGLGYKRSMDSKVLEQLTYINQFHYDMDFYQRIAKNKFKFVVPNIKGLTNQVREFEALERFIDELALAAWPFSSEERMLNWWNSILADEDQIGQSILSNIQKMNHSVIQVYNMSIRKQMDEAMQFIKDEDSFPNKDPERFYSRVPDLSRLCEITLARLVAEGVLTVETKCEIIAYTAGVGLALISSTIFTSLVYDMFKIMRLKEDEFDAAFEPMSLEFKFLLINYTLAECKKFKVYNKFLEVLTYGLGLYTNTFKKLPTFATRNTKVIFACMAQAIMRNAKFFDRFLGCSLRCISGLGMDQNAIEDLEMENMDGHFIDVSTFKVIMTQRLEMISKNKGIKANLGPIGDMTPNNGTAHSVPDYSEFISLSDYETYPTDEDETILNDHLGDKTSGTTSTDETQVSENLVMSDDSMFD